MASKIVQVNVGSVQDAIDVFNRDSAGQLAVVVIPRSACCFSCWLNIPSGMFVLEQSWLQDKGAAQPGLKVFWPGWRRISHIVTQGSKTYNAPVQNCPTADNVLVNVDVSITFYIGPGVDEAKKFVYSLGASRLDELLSSQTEEAIRALVYGVPAMRVHDLREEFAIGMLNNLNQTVNRYGVNISNVKITNVKLPNELEQTLQNTASFKTAMEQAEKDHLNDIRLVVDNASLELSGLKQYNQRKVQDMAAAAQRAIVEREEEKTDMQSKIEVNQLNASSYAETAITKATSEKDVAFSEGHNAATSLKLRVRAECEAAKVAAAKKALTEVQRSAAKLDTAVARAQAQLAEAQAEAASADALVDERAFDLANKRYAVLGNLAVKSRMVISGQFGEDLIQTICPGSHGDLSNGLGK